MDMVCTTGSLIGGKRERQVLRHAPLTSALAFGIADPCVLGEPLVRHTAERAVGPAEEHRGGAEGRNFNLSTGGDCPPGLRATNHKHAHTTRSLERAYWSFAKRR